MESGRDFEEEPHLDFLLRLHHRVETDLEAGIEPVVERYWAPEDGDGRRKLIERELTKIAVQLEPDVAGYELPERFEVVRELGRGGMSAVFEAEDRHLGRRVAVKLLLRGHHLSPTALARFERESKIAASFDDPALCQLFERRLDAEPPFLVMRLVEGRTLADLLREARAGSAGRLVLDRDESRERPGTARRAARAVVALLARAARALDRVHEAGIVHRDVKPSNIMVQPDGGPVVLDFGVSAIEDSDPADRLTGTGGAPGTVAYMSPEQVRGDREHVNARTDVFALAVTLFECLTLERPFTGPTDLEIRDAILRAPVPDPRRLNPAVDGGLATVLETGLDREVGRRYRSMAAFADDLEAWLADRPLAARRAGPVLTARRFVRRNPVACAAAAVVFVVLGLSGAVLFVLYREAEKSRLDAEEARRAERESTVAQARLLARRGLWDDAHARVEAADDDDLPVEMQIELLRAGLHVAFARDDRAEIARCLQLIEAAGRPGDVAFVELYRGDLLMSDLATVGDGIRRVEAALATSPPLDPADELYARGLVAETAPQALAEFRRALAVDRLHHRAWTGVTSVLLFLVRLDEMIEETTAMRRVFPADPYPVLLEAVAWGLKGDLAAAKGVLDGAAHSLPSERRESFLTGLRSFSEALETTRRGRLPKISRFDGLEYLSVPTFHRFAEHFTAMFQVTMSLDPAGGNAAQRRTLLDLVEKLPDGYLWAAVGASHTLDGLVSERAGKREEVAEHIRKALDAFRRSFETPSLISDPNRARGQSVMLREAIASYYSDLFQVDDDFRRETVEIALGIDPAAAMTDAVVVAARALRTFATVGVARSYIHRGLLASHNPELLVQMAELEHAAGDAASALKYASDALKALPGHGRMAEIRRASIDAIRRIEDL